MIDKPQALTLAGVIGVCLICSNGCNTRNYDGPARAAVAGLVTLDGMPIDGGIINLIPVASEGNRKASAPIDKGQYNIIEERGPNLGNCLVDIRWLKPTGRKVQDQGSVAEGPVDELIEAVPEKYNTKTTLRVDIVTGKNSHNFELTTK